MGSLEERMDWEAAYDPDDQRTAIQLVPDGEDDGYLLILHHDKDEVSKVFDFSYYEGGDVIDACLNAVERLSDTRGYE